MVKRFLPGLFASICVAVSMLTANLAPVPRWIAIAAAAASLAVPALLGDGDVRTHATGVLAIAAVTAAGLARGGGRPYEIAAVVFAFVCVASMRRTRPPRGGGVLRAAGAKRSAVILGAVTLAVAAPLVTQLPRLGRAVERRVTPYLMGAVAEDSVGFSSRMTIGTTRGMLQSDVVVLRIEGASVDYLRGATYDTYKWGTWTSETDRREVGSADAKPERVDTRIVFARSAPVARGREARWFLPANACDLATPSELVSVDNGAIAHPEPEGDDEAISFRAACDKPFARARDPGPVDLDVPKQMAGRLAPIAAEWTRGMTDPRAKVVAIEHQLQTFGYSFDVDRTVGYDPILDFLTIHKEGYCEHFASALALLARSAGVPTRIVSGYRVTERSPRYGYAIVRERNAHSWVEAWVDGAWHAYDPTPVASEIMHQESAGLGDEAAFLLDRFVVVVYAIGWVRIGLGLVGLIIMLLLTRRFLAARKKRADEEAVMIQRPLPCFVTLEVALAGAGHPRESSEPIELFAARVAGAGTPWADQAAEALGAYAKLRYGGIGEEQSVASAMDEATSRVRREYAPSAPASTTSG